MLARKQGSSRATASSRWSAWARSRSTASTAPLVRVRRTSSAAAGASAAIQSRAHRSRSRSMTGSPYSTGRPPAAASAGPRSGISCGSGLPVPTSRRDPAAAKPSCATAARCAIRVPARPWETTTPERARWRYAATAVLRLMPSCSARARTGGSSVAGRQLAAVHESAHAVGDLDGGAAADPRGVVRAHPLESKGRSPCTVPDRGLLASGRWCVGLCRASFWPRPMWCREGRRVGCRRPAPRERQGHPHEHHPAPPAPRTTGTHGTGRARQAGSPRC